MIRWSCRPMPRMNGLAEEVCPAENPVTISRRRRLKHEICFLNPFEVMRGPSVCDPLQLISTCLLHDAFKTAMHDRAHIDELAKYDQDLAYLGPEAYAQAMRDTYQTERRAVERMGLARDR